MPVENGNPRSDGSLSLIFALSTMLALVLHHGLQTDLA